MSSIETEHQLSYCGITIMILLRYVVSRVATMTTTQLLASAVESVLVKGGFPLIAEITRRQFFQ